jgi:hypothetical protein
MNRRNLLSLATLSTLAWAITPLSAKTNTDPWKAMSSKEAIKILYEDRKLIKDDKIKITSYYTDCLSSSSLKIHSNIEAKKVIIFKDLDNISRYRSFIRYALVCIFEVPKDALVRYYLKIKSTNEEGTIIVLIEDIKGNVYRNTLRIG